MTLSELASLQLDPSLILVRMGMEPDSWQKKLLLSTAPQVLLNCSRQAGKSTTTAVLAIHQSLFTPKSLTLLLSPSDRQSGEIFRKVLTAYNALGRPLELVKRTERAMELSNGSRIVSLPGKEETVRCFSGVNLLILDEAARVPDDLYKSVRPMLATSKGRIIGLSTPKGQRGWFWREYTGDNPWLRICATYHDCPRITEEFVQGELRSLGQNWVDQEFNCLFTTMEGLVYPDFPQCIMDTMCMTKGSPVGGIDFGWRNPFAALWGFHDRQTDILWISHERYARETLLHEHINYLKQFPGVMWIADPAGATEIGECRAAGLHLRKGNNDIALGVAAVTARIRTGRLKVARASCPMLIEESKLYRYPDANERVLMGEKPIDSDNHALAALRYLVSILDKRFIAKLRKKPIDGAPEPDPDPEVLRRQDAYTSQSKNTTPKPWLRLDNEMLWPASNN